MLVQLQDWTAWTVIFVCRDFFFPSHQCILSFFVWQKKNRQAVYYKIHKHANYTKTIFHFKPLLFMCDKIYRVFQQRWAKLGATLESKIGFKFDLFLTSQLYFIYISDYFCSTLLMQQEQQIFSVLCVNSLVVCRLVDCCRSQCFVQN